jgi:hypothetical protein
MKFDRKINRNIVIGIILVVFIILLIKLFWGYYNEGSENENINEKNLINLISQ